MKTRRVRGMKTRRVDAMRGIPACNERDKDKEQPPAAGVVHERGC